MDIPKIGLGTRKLESEESIKDALSIGYAHFDTARIYKNEEILGKVIGGNNSLREKLWITTKIWFDYVPNHKYHIFKPGDFLYTKLDERLEQTFRDLKTSYIDLVLLHWPTNMDNDAYAFEKLLGYKKQGRIKHLGVSNFPKQTLDSFYKYFGKEIEFDQIERHACLGNQELEDFAKDKTIKIIAYSPLGHGHLLKNQLLKKIAQQEGVTVSQVCIAYDLGKNFITIPKATTYKNLEENYQAKEIILSEENMKLIDNLPKNYRYNNPPFSPNREG